MASSSLSGCGVGKTKVPAVPTAVPRPPTSTDWRRLGEALTGTLVLPSSRQFGTDRLLYNSKFSELHPAAIAYCATSDDVVRCVGFVAAHALEIAARSGGHSYAGYSSCPGLVVDVSRLNAITVDPRANTATVGTGARMIDVYNAVGNRDRLLPGGSCPTVGIAGLTLGGGAGVFGRKFGLTCDSLRSTRVVTADGQRLVVDSSSHPDLLWASQGGGGGNFGIATSFEFVVHPMPRVTLFTLQYPWEVAPSMLEAWLHWVDAMPDELWSNCQLFSQGTSGYLAQIGGVFCGSSSSLTQLLATLRSSIGTTPSSVFVGADDYLRAMMIEAGCSELSVASCHLATDNHRGVLGHEAYSAKSSYLDAPITPDHAALLVHAVEVLRGYAPTVGGGLAFDAYGGAINRVEPAQTAFVHRTKLAGIQAAYSWSSYTPSTEIAAGRRWLDWLGSHVFDPKSGAYQNYIDPTLADWATAYYGTNLDRLTQIKRTYDPGNTFSFAQSIPVHP